MPFTIPNAASAEDVTQAQPDSVDFAIMVAAFSGTGVVSGCAVTAQGTPNMTVAVAAGTIAVNGTQVAVSGGNVTITTANATNPRFDLICVDNAGTKSAVAGTPAAAPVFPAIPANSVVLAAVRVPAAASSINTPKITDKRVTAVVYPAVQAFSVGMIMPYSGSAAPSGWQLCDGSAISRTTFATLFALIGTTYGNGDGSTTFNVPDLRGRIPVGYAASGGHADVSALGNNEGSILINRRPRHPHSHTLTLPNHIHSNTFTLPNHTHSDTISFSDTGHGHGITDPQHRHFIAGQVGGGTYGGFNNSQGGQNDGFSGYSSTGITINTGSAALVKTGNVGNPSSNPALSGAIGNPTSTPSVDGAIGAAGVANDSGAYLVVNYMIKT